MNPCAGCPAEARSKIPPVIPPDVCAVVVSEAPTEQEECAGALRPVSAPELAALSVGRACLTRCRPVLVSDAQRREMRRRCAAFLRADLPPGAPVITAGDEATYALLGSRERGAAYWRGLWVRAAAEWGERRVFPLVEGDRLAGDLARFIRTLSAPAPQPRHLEVVVDPGGVPGRTVMRRLAEHPGPWAFDVESYDGAAFPSRPGVPTDPCHPDFRVRGVAVAWSEDEGAWLELAPLGPEAWRPWLAPVFGSPAVKAAQGGHFDEEALVVPGWVPAVVNRGEDSMLAALSLSDGRHASLRLERLAADLLGADPWWDAADKARMRDLPLADVARAAVLDAGMALWVCTHARDLMERGEYWSG